MRMNTTMLFFVVLSGVAVWRQTAQDLEGIGLGKLKVPSGPLLDITVEVEKKPDNRLVTEKKFSSVFG